MTKKERFYATIARETVDRPASWLGLPVPEALPAIYDYFKVKSVDELKDLIGDDVYPIEVPFHKEPGNHIAMAFDFAKQDDSGDQYEERTLTAPGFFEDVTDLSVIDDFNWPKPKDHMSFDECKKLIDDAPQNYALMGIMWSAHFQDACAAFGMENALMSMIVAPDMFDAVIDKITDFYLEANEIFYEAGKGKLDAVLIGNDFGSQRALMLSPDLLRKHVFRGTRKLVEQAHSYGYKVVHHSCGAIHDIIPDLLDLGVDIIHPIQALATNMDPYTLKKDFADKAAFCGGVDAQELLVNGTPEEVAAKVKELKELFPTGLVLSPSHEAILEDINPANIEALFAELKK
jgi:uroporphyrinogen decarboxylase